MIFTEDFVRKYDISKYDITTINNEYKINIIFGDSDVVTVYSESTTDYNVLCRSVVGGVKEHLIKLRDKKIKKIQNKLWMEVN